MSRVIASSLSNPPRKKVGLIGFFGWGNFGDELFVETYRRILGERFDLSVIHDRIEKPYFSRSVEDVVAEYDALVIGGGDLVIPRALSGLYWRMEYLAKPVFVHSVGVPASGGHKRPVVQHMREFLTHANVRRIAARDTESASWIARHMQRGDVITEPDMVCALDLPRVKRPEKPLLGIVTRHNKAGVDDYTQLGRLCEKAERAGFGIRQIVLGNGFTGRNDLAAANAFAFPGKELIHSEDIWDQCRAIGECTVLASMKLHGTIVATMYGVPTIVLAPTDKTCNFLRRIDRPDLLSDLNDPALSDHFDPALAPISEDVRQALSSGARAGLERLGNDLAAC